MEEKLAIKDHFKHILAAKNKAQTQAGLGSSYQTPILV